MAINSYLSRPLYGMRKTTDLNPHQQLTALYENERGALIRNVKSRLRRKTEAEDLVQDVFVKLWEADLDPIENLAGYVYTALANRVRDWLRRKAYQEQELTEAWAQLIADTQADQATSFEQKERVKALWSAIAELPTAQQAVLIATEIEGWKFEELADLWDESIGTLLSRKYRAVKALRKKIHKLF